LVEHCHGCGRRVAATDLFTGRCPCGSQLTPSESRAIASDAARWSFRLWGEVDQLLIDGAARRDADESLRHRLLELILVERLVRFAAGRGTQHWPYRHLPFFDRQARSAHEYGVLDSASPIGVIDLLKGVTSAFDKTSFRKEIARIQAEAQAKQTAFLLLPLEHYLDVLATTGAAVRARGDGRYAQLRTRNSTTIVQAGRLLGTSLPTIRTLIEEGVISPLKSASDRRVTHYHFSDDRQGSSHCWARSTTASQRSVHVAFSKV
jgi:hypothetical protein